MSETYKFYIEMDGQVFGPYTARQTRELDLPDDILVTEESMNGQWFPACQFDFDDMIRKESVSGIPRRPIEQQAPTAPPQAASNVLNNNNVSNQDVNVNVQFTPSTTVVGPSNVRINPDGSVTTLSNWGTCEEIPDEAYNWNWGAFYFGWFWGIFNGVAWSLLTILIIWIPLINIIIAIIFGVKGGRWAWRGKRWRSVEHFERVQHNWAVAALICFLISLILSVAIIVAYTG